MALGTRQTAARLPGRVTPTRLVPYPDPSPVTCPATARASLRADLPATGRATAHRASRARQRMTRTVVTTVDPRADLSALHGPGGSGLRFLIGQYVALTKPRIIELLLITTVPVMFLAARGVPDLLLVLATLVGGTLSAGSANTLNCYIDRDIDAVMHRTKKPASRHRHRQPSGCPHLRHRPRRSCRPLGSGCSSTGSAPGSRSAALAVLRRRLHAAAQAPHRAEHRLGRRRRLHAGPRRLVRRDQLPVLGRRSSSSWSSSSGPRRTTGRCP